MRTSQKFGFAFVCVLLSLPAFAQGPPIFTESPIMLGLEGRGIRTFGKYVDAESANTYVQVLAVPYNISTTFQVGGVATLVQKSPEGMPGRTGFGDATIFLKQQVLQQDAKGKTFRILLKGTLGLPTADNSREPVLGSGVWNAGFGAITGYITTRLGLYAESGYRWRAGGNPGQFYYNMAVSVPMLPQQYPPKQLNISADLNGNVNAASGEHTLFVSPGLQWIAGRRFLLESGVQLPLTQGSPEGQKIKYVFLLGVRILIF